MKKRKSLAVVFMALAVSGVGLSCLSSCLSVDAKEETRFSLKDIYGDKFLMGVALNSRQVSGEDSIGAAVAIQHFNSIVAENAMKCAVIHPEENKYNWKDADAFVKFGEDHNMFIVGHCLVWHSQCALWFCVDKNGNPVDAETLRNRIRDHIYAVVGRYKGRVKGWDVVNEVVVEDGSYRKSPFYQILGEEFIPLAFQYAHEADPDAELYINDYGMDNENRRNKYVEIVNDLKKRGLRIDAVGMQSHVGLDYPDFDEYEKSLLAFAGTGCKVMVTEWDMTALPTITQSANVADTVSWSERLNPYPNGLPEDVAARWNDRMEKMMRLLLRHSDVVSRFNAWGVCDGDSWKNNWPVAGRRDYPLLFDRDYNPKAFLFSAIEEKQMEI